MAQQRIVKFTVNFEIDADKVIPMLYLNHEELFNSMFDKMLIEYINKYFTGGDIQNVIDQTSPSYDDVVNVEIVRREE